MPRPTLPHPGLLLRRRGPARRIRGTPEHAPHSQQRGIPWSWGGASPSRWVNPFRCTLPSTSQWTWLSHRSNRKNGFVNWVGVFFFCRIMVDQYKSVWDCCDQFDEILETTWIKREGLFFMLLSLTKKTCCWVIIWWINCDFIIFTKLWIRCCWHICVWIEPPQMNHWRAAKTFQWHCLLPLCKRATSRSCLHQSCQL